MDPVVIDSVTADSLEVGDLIKIGKVFLTVSNAEDHTHYIDVFFDDWGYERFDPDAKVDLYAYPAVEI